MNILSWIYFFAGHPVLAKRKFLYAERKIGRILDRKERAGVAAYHLYPGFYSITWPKQVMHGNGN